VGGGCILHLFDREKFPKFALFAYYNFAQCIMLKVACGMRGLCIRACVLVVVEMPFSSMFSASAGATDLLLGWKVAQKLALRSLMLKRGSLTPENIVPCHVIFNVTLGYKVSAFEDRESCHVIRSVAVGDCNLLQGENW
jgi:hypothetical protein